MLQFLWLLSAQLVVNAKPSHLAERSPTAYFAFRAVTNADSHSLGDKKFLGGNHVGAGHSIGTLFPEAERSCDWFFEKGNLAYYGGTPVAPYAAYLENSYGINQVLNFAPGELAESYWSTIDNGASSAVSVLAYVGQTNFIACPAVLLPDGPEEWTVALGSEHPGCIPIQLIAEECSTSQKLIKRQTTGEIFPGLLVPVQPANPNQAYGTVYVPELKSAQPLEIGFSVPIIAGSTCDLVFHLPGSNADSTNPVASYSITGAASFTAQLLAGPVTTSTTYNNKPGPQGDSVSFILKPGGDNFIASFPCSQTGQQAFELKALGDSYAK